MDGFFYVNKPKGITSFSVCHKIQRELNIKKTGHNGTLDPDATGVMLVACGKATKLLPFFNIHDKKYIAEITFGYETTTLDAGGEITKTGPGTFTEIEIKKAIDILTENKEQLPPMYSAIKINGQKMVDLARKNQTVDIPKREITYLEKPKILSHRIKEAQTVIEVELYVSKGFYVRSFCRDLGHLLSSYATMTNLERIASGSIEIIDCDGLDMILSKRGTFHTIEEVLKDFSKVNVSDYIAKLVKNGVVLDQRQAQCENNILVYHNTSLIAVYEYCGNGQYKNVVIL